MGIAQITLVLATFLCSLVAGFLFAFAVVLMPGTGRLEDREFIRAFQAIDGVIQDNQPLFLLVWVGSVAALVGSILLNIGRLDGTGYVLLSCAVFVFLLGVQLPTVAINVPLNNQLQALDLGSMSEAKQHVARGIFEPRWNRWNSIRTAFASLTVVLLMTLLLRL